MLTCTKCGETKDCVEFHKNRSTKTGHHPWCKQCYNSAHKSTARVRKWLSEPENRRKHNERTQPLWNANNARWRADCLQRALQGYEQELKTIYKNCPEGHHVDHIVPLKGKLVSGLHVPWNLQYLPAIDNIKKSNYFDLEL